MSTSSPSTGRRTYRQMVAEVAERAKSILPTQVNGRIESAVKLVLQGDVEMLDDGTWRVGSSDPARWYHLVGTTCTCTDYVQQKAPEGWCKHRISAGILKRVTELMPHEPAQPRGDITVTDTTPAPPPTHSEAPASVNVRVLVQGYEVQWTLRDSDESRLAERLQALLKRPDIRPVPKPAPRSQQWRKGGQHG